VSDANGNRAPVLLYIYALLLGVVALALLVGGAQLALLGGSPYYVLSGIALLAGAFLLFRRSASGAKLFGLFMLATVAWSLWEVGFDGWKLMPRVIAPAVFGAGFLFPAVRRPLGLSGWASGAAWGRGALAAIGAVVLGFALHAAVGPYQPADPIYQAGTGTAGPAIVDKTIDSTDWRYFDGNNHGSRFTALDQITPANVDQLEVAWTFRTGPDPKGVMATAEAPALKIGDTLYNCTDFNDVYALDAETGKQKWRFRSGTDMSMSKYTHCRGVTYYAVPNAKGLCATRIYTTTLKGTLNAMDAQTGAACPGFGANGAVNIYEGLGTTDPGYYNVTSAPTLARGRLVLNAMVADGQHWLEPSGVIRAFDAVTGKLAWAWDMGRPERTGLPPAGETYTKSTPNSWPPMSADEELGLVYAATGNTAGTDYYGAQRRPFDDKYSTSVVALDIETGRPRWHYQTLRHDLWDLDNPSQPVLVDVPRKDGTIEKGLIQPTKRGEVFYLDRATGKPLAKVVDRKVPTKGALPEERIAPTQPFSVGMPSLAGPDLTERAMWGITPLDQLWCRLDFKQRRYEGTLTPPGITPSLTFPGYAGGTNWGSAAIDRDRHIAILKSTYLPTRARLMPRAEADKAGLKALAPGVKIDMAGSHAQIGVPYAAEISPMLSPLFLPCLSPPMGKISAIDLRTRKLLWSRPLGTGENSGPLGMKSHLPLPFGVINLSGSLVTRSGITFVAGTNDQYLRALDTTTGKEIWKTRLPVAGYATPMSYFSTKSGRQMVVLAATGNARMGADLGDYLIAFALPKKAIR
jgi:quinoprotein glucose dehydrogenase